jgi:hypothetical protein
MAIGDTVQAGLGRMDFSAFQTAGAAQARANEAFGNALGQAATAYFAGKEKKERANEMTQYLMGQGASEEDAKAIAKNPFLQNEYQRKQAADQQMKIAQMQARTSIANSKRAATTANQAQNLKERQFEAEQDLLDEQKALNESLAKFSMQPVQTPTPEFSALQQEYRPEQIPGTPEFIAMQEEPIPERPSIIAKYITEKPDFKRFEKQDSPAVAQLPNSFKPQGRRIQEAVESGELSDKAGMVAINNLAQQATAGMDDFATLRKAEADMRKEFNALDATKDFGDVRTAFLKVKTAAENPSAAGDLALVFNYMKILDPGSVVREGEFQTAADATSWLQRSENDGIAIPLPIAKAIRKLEDGTLLTPDQRDDFLSTARNTASAQFKPAKEALQRYKGLAANSGLRVDQIIPSNYLQIEEELSPSKPQGPGIDTKQGTYRIPGQLSVEGQ